MPDTYIYRRTALLGPPSTDRTFYTGESVVKEDFARCPWMWDTLIRRQAITPAINAEEAERGRQLRYAATRQELLLVPDASPEMIEETLAARRQPPAPLPAIGTGLVDASDRPREVVINAAEVPPMPPIRSAVIEAPSASEREATEEPRARPADRARR